MTREGKVRGPNNEPGLVSASCFEAGWSQRSGSTFHCRLRELLVRWVSLGDSGTSGTLQCVVKEQASEQGPRAELYVADTL